MIPEWAEKYIGIPFGEKGNTYGGKDCWQMARMVMQNEFGFTLPDYDDQYAHSTDNVSIDKAARLAVDHWVRREREWIEVIDDLQCGDLAFGHLFGSLHCGIILDHEFLLHIVKGSNASRARYKSAIWRNRFDAFYRHRSLHAG
jgi:cell wall-associated NlpC family hydrolase